MGTLKRRIEEMERLQLKRHLELAAKKACWDPVRRELRTGRNGNVILVLRDPENLAPEDCTRVESPTDGKGPNLILPQPRQPTTVEPQQQVTYGGLDEPEEGNG
jgi:hypothetical protein